jgi:hypothetical protein
LVGTFATEKVTVLPGVKQLAGLTVMGLAAVVISGDTTTLFRLPVVQPAAVTSTLPPLAPIVAVMEVAVLAVIFQSVPGNVQVRDVLAGTFATEKVTELPANKQPVVLTVMGLAAVVITGDTTTLFTLPAVQPAAVTLTSPPLAPIVAVMEVDVLLVIVQPAPGRVQVRVVLAGTFATEKVTEAPAIKQLAGLTVMGLAAVVISGDTTTLFTLPPVQPVAEAVTSPLLVPTVAVMEVLVVEVEVEVIVQSVPGNVQVRTALAGTLATEKVTELPGVKQLAGLTVMGLAAVVSWRVTRKGSEGVAEQPPPEA